MAALRARLGASSVLLGRQDWDSKFGRESETLNQKAENLNKVIQLKPSDTTSKVPSTAFSVRVFILACM